MSEKDRRSDRDIVREALERAHQDFEPDTGRLLDSVPAMMAEAVRRRRLAGKIGPMAGAVSIGRRAVPVLAAATVILLAVAALLFYGESGESPLGTDRHQSLDRLILTGGAEGAEGEDLLMEAIVGEVNGNG